MAAIGGAEAVVLLLLVAVWASLVVVNFMKGKVFFGLISLAGGWLGVVGAVRLAKPDSSWAKRYDPSKLALSMARFPENARRVDPDWVSTLSTDPSRPSFTSDNAWPDDDPALWDKITRKAYKKQHGHWPEDAPQRAPERPSPPA